MRNWRRLIPARLPGVYQMAIKDPVGAVAAFTPWNFPINQVVKKLSAAGVKVRLSHLGSGRRVGASSRGLRVGNREAAVACRLAIVQESGDRV